MSTSPETTARLLISCPDRPGIVAAVTNFLYHHGANVTELDQHSSDPQNGRFFLRLEFQTPDLDVSGPALQRAFAEVVAERFGMEWRMSFAAQKPRMALLVSKHDHALLEILWRWSRQELRAHIPLVISNHPDLQAAVESFGVRFVHVPFDAQSQEAAEQKMLELLQDQVDIVVLARFMRILSAQFVSHFPHRIINIHHSFLPAFAGADPYRQAYERGVKFIGATCHYVTGELDAGPIIEQEVERVQHHHSVLDLVRLGRDCERSALARGIRYHVHDRTIIDGKRAIVFPD